MELMSMENLFKRAGLNYEEMEINKPYYIYDKNIRIKSFNHDKKCNEMKRIISLIRKDDSEVYELITRSGDLLLRCSGGHRIFNTKNGEYVSVKDIESGVAFSSSGEGIEFFVKNTGKKEVIVDMHVEDNENYFTNGLLSHNTGGEALKFFSSIRRELARCGYLKDGAGDTIGIRVRMKTVKNKISAPFSVCEFDILFGHGIDTYGEVIDIACDYGIIDKNGSWFAYKDMKLGQGRQNTSELFKKEDKLFQEIKSAVLERMYLESIGEKPIIEESESETSELPTT